MFKKDLIRRLELIFEFDKTTFDQYSDQFEQDTLFIEIESSRPRMGAIGGGIETARVTGQLVAFSKDESLPYGYFAKFIEKAPHELKDPFIFFEIDTDRPDSPARMVNIHERRTGFVFRYNSQYDPSRGEITELDTTLNFKE